jgi:hypothetical protein
VVSDSGDLEKNIFVSAQSSKIYGDYSRQCAAKLFCALLLFEMFSFAAVQKEMEMLTKMEMAREMEMGEINRDRDKGRRRYSRQRQRD